MTGFLLQITTKSPENFYNWSRKGSDFAEKSGILPLWVDLRSRKWNSGVVPLNSAASSTNTMNVIVRCKPSLKAVDSFSFPATLLRTPAAAWSTRFNISKHLNSLVCSTLPARLVQWKTASSTMAGWEAGFLVLLGSAAMRCTLHMMVQRLAEAKVQQAGTQPSCSHLLFKSREAHLAEEVAFAQWGSSLTVVKQQARLFLDRLQLLDEGCKEWKTRNQGLASSSHIAIPGASVS